MKDYVVSPARDDWDHGVRLVSSGSLGGNETSHLKSHCGDSELEDLTDQTFPALGAEDRQQQLFDQFTEGMLPA